MELVHKNSFSFKVSEIMLEKNAILGVAKDEQGLVLVDKTSKKGARMQNDLMLQLTLGVWDFCDRMEPADIANEMTKGSTVPAEQLEILRRVVDEALNFFVQAGWATVKGGPSSGKKIEKKKETRGESNARRI